MHHGRHIGSDSDSAERFTHSCRTTTKNFWLRRHRVRMKSYVTFLFAVAVVISACSSEPVPTALDPGLSTTIVTPTTTTTTIAAPETTSVPSTTTPSTTAVETTTSQVAPTTVPAPEPIDNTLIQLVDPHDEPEFYCVDVRGVDATLDIDAALTAHTCKPFFDDELFNVHDPATGSLYMPAYDRCVEAASAAVGSELFIVDCESSELQNFDILDDGTIRLAPDSTLCLGVGTDPGEPTGGPSHLRRVLGLFSCADHPSTLTTWIIPGPDINT